MSIYSRVCPKNKYKKTQSVASPRTKHLSMIPIMTFTFELWSPKSIEFTMVYNNMSTKFEEEASNGLVCIRFTAYFHTCPLWPWPLTSKINRVHPLTMVNISAKVWKRNTQRFSLYCVHKLIFIYVHCDLDLWPPKINRVSSSYHG